MALNYLKPKVKPARMYLVRALAVLALSSCVVANTKYCSENLIPSDTTYMQFTKEPVVEDYGYPNLLKSIHCCVKGYWSIEWFKDGIPYPWSAGWSNFILYPESGNQTLYVHQPQFSDSGDYVCRVSNRTYTMEHHIKLEILKRIADSPRMLYISADQIVEEGKPLRLFCEAILGRKFLADAPFDLRWWKMMPNGTEGNLLPTQIEHNTSRSDVISIIGSYLTVERMAPQDYGNYLCAIHCNAAATRNFVSVSRPIPVERGSSWHAGKVPRRVLIMTGAGLLIFAISVMVLHQRCTPHLLLFGRNLRALVATRAQRARGYGELLSDCGRCRSLVAVVSPTQHSPAQLLMALRQLRALPLSPVVVLLQDLPDLRQDAKDSGETLVDLIRRMRLVPWRNVQDREFWTAMRLALPLPPLPQPDSQSLASSRQSDGTLGDVYNTGSLMALV